jgi:hypothetical protein
MKATAHNSLNNLVGAPGFEPGASCAQGRRATRLRYAPTVTALFILKHFPTLLLILVVNFDLTVPKLASVFEKRLGLMYRLRSYWNPKELPVRRRDQRRTGNAARELSRGSVAPLSEVQGECLV